MPSEWDLGTHQGAVSASTSFSENLQSRNINSNHNLLSLILKSRSPTCEDWKHVYEKKRFSKCSICCHSNENETAAVVDCVELRSMSSTYGISAQYLDVSTQSESKWWLMATQLWSTLIREWVCVTPNFFFLNRKSHMLIPPKKGFFWNCFDHHFDACF